MASQQENTRPLSRRNPLARALRRTVFLLASAGWLFAQDGNWSYQAETDKFSDLRSDEVWNKAVAPSSPAYQLGISCEDTEYVSILVRSDAVITAAARLAVSFDGGAAEDLPVQYSLATAKSFSFEPGGQALRRILASKKMAFSLQNGDLQEVAVQFNVEGLEVVMKEMPGKCQERLAELIRTEAKSKPAARARRSS
jgi:hypothetical protein